MITHCLIENNEKQSENQPITITPLPYTKKTHILKSLKLSADWNEARNLSIVFDVELVSRTDLNSTYPNFRDKIPVPLLMLSNINIKEILENYIDNLVKVYLPQFYKLTGRFDNKDAQMKEEFEKRMGGDILPNIYTQYVIEDDKASNTFHFINNQTLDCGWEKRFQLSSQSMMSDCFQPGRSVRSVDLCMGDSKNRIFLQTIHEKLLTKYNAKNLVNPPTRHLSWHIHPYTQKKKSRGRG